MKQKILPALLFILFFSAEVFSGSKVYICADDSTYEESKSPADSTYQGKDFTFPESSDTTVQPSNGNEYSIPDNNDSTYKSRAGASEEDTVEIYVIDNYIESDQHNLFVISFFTSERTKSLIRFDNNKEIIISSQLSESHRDTIDIANLKLKTKSPSFVIVVEDSLGRKFTSDKYELEIPQDVDIKGESNFLLLCLFGGTVFALPYPEYVNWNRHSFFGITKEIPLVFLRSNDFEYPMGYFSIEYSLIFNTPVSNFLRIGYKHIFPVKGIEYISPGLSGFTNFNGFNGVSPEITVGWFKIFDVFTVYSRFRWNVKPSDKSEFRDISIGLYSGFFAIYF